MIIVPRILIEQALIESRQSRTIQPRQNGRQILVHQRYSRTNVVVNATQHAWQALLKSLKGEALKIVALQQVG